MSEGKVIAWVIYDAKTGEIVTQCSSRREARELAGKDGRIGKVLESH